MPSLLKACWWGLVTMEIEPNLSTGLPGPGDLPSHSSDLIFCHFLPPSQREVQCLLIQEGFWEWMVIALLSLPSLPWGSQGREDHKRKHAHWCSWWCSPQKEKGEALVVTQGPVLPRAPCTWFHALQSPSWNSYKFWTNSPSFSFCTGPGIM